MKESRMNRYLQFNPEARYSIPQKFIASKPQTVKSTQKHLTYYETDKKELSAINFS